MLKTNTGQPFKVEDIYGGEMIPGDLPAEQHEIDAWNTSRAPKPIDQIRAMERTQVVRDAMERASRLANLVTARAELVRQQAARVPPFVVTNDQAHAFLLAKDGHYKVLWDLEQLVEPLRKQIV